MPLLKLETTVPLPDEKGKPLLAALSKAVASATGKPEQYVMVAASQLAMLMSGTQPIRAGSGGGSPGQRALSAVSVRASGCILL